MMISAMDVIQAATPPWTKVTFYVENDEGVFTERRSPQFKHVQRLKIKCRSCLLPLSESHPLHEESVQLILSNQPNTTNANRGINIFLHLVWNKKQCSHVPRILFYVEDDSTGFRPRISTGSETRFSVIFELRVKDFLACRIGRFCKQKSET